METDKQYYKLMSILCSEVVIKLEGNGEGNHQVGTGCGWGEWFADGPVNTRQQPPEVSLWVPEAEDKGFKTRREG